MNGYDFTEASNFLANELEATPEELYEEITAAMSAVATIENKRNRKLTDSVYQTLLTCADLVERITPVKGM